MKNYSENFSANRGGVASLNGDALQQISALNREVQEVRHQLDHMSSLFMKLVEHHNQVVGFVGAMRNGLRRFIPRALLPMRVALAEHCNLNCRGCDHFAPIAEPQLADFTDNAA